MQKLAATSVLVAGAVALGACGDDDEKQAKTIVQTVTAPAAPQTPPPVSTTPTETQPPAPTTPARPLPEGVVGADGTYTMEVEESDYEGENLIQDEVSPPSDWRFTTTCEGETCSVRMRRELESGGFKMVTLQPAEGRPNVYEGRATSTDECLVDPKKATTRQRYAVRLVGEVDGTGRPTAKRIDVYLTERAPTCSKETKGTIFWRGRPAEG